MLPFPRGERGWGSPFWGPRDNPEFCITAAIRTTRRVPHSADPSMPPPPPLSSLRYMSPCALVTVVGRYVYSMYI